MTTAVAVVPKAPAQVARQVIAHHSKSFALASALLGARVRDQAAVIYTWCRRADDAVDEPSTTLAEALATQHSDLATAYAGTASDPVLAAFGEVARARQIPIHYPTELLAGMAMDADGTHYATTDELLGYCYRVAGTVGLMMSHVFGVRDDAALVHAAHLGIGMQLTNICRDVAEDWTRGRLYLPDELLARHGAGGLASQLGGPLPVTSRAGCAATVRELLALADGYYRSGDRGVRYLPWRAAVAVRAARRIYSAIGGRIADVGHDVTAGRAVVPTASKLRHATVAALRVAVATPARIARAIAGPPVHIPTRILEAGDVTAP